MDGQPFDEIQRSDERDIDAAVQAARAAFNGAWGQLAAAERGRLMMALAERVEAHADEPCTAASKPAAFGRL